MLALLQACSVTALAGATSATLSTMASTLDCIEDGLYRSEWNRRMRLAAR